MKKRELKVEAQKKKRKMVIWNLIIEDQNGVDVVLWRKLFGIPASFLFFSFCSFSLRFFFAFTSLLRLFPHLLLLSLSLSLLSHSHSTKPSGAGREGHINIKYKIINKPNAKNGNARALRRRFTSKSK